MSKRVRVVKICQYEVNPKTGEDLHFDENNILSALEHKTITSYAYILHDKDVYTDNEEDACIKALELEYNRLDDTAKADVTKETYIAEHQWVRAGAVKPKHWHIVARADKSPVELATWATWFGVPENLVDIAHGRGAFLDCVEYLTHERDNQQEAGKHLYADEEVHANFDFRKELTEAAARRLKYGGRDVNKKTWLRCCVLNGEMSLSDVRNKYMFEYIEDTEKLTKLRYEYLQNADLPEVRHNYYICGGGGIGKDVASRLLARSLYPDIKEDRDLYFNVGAQGTTFEGYDGQPVIIWSDCRAIDLIQKLGGRGNVFNVFDTSPRRQRQNIKYGSVNLINTVNIVNSVQPYTEFLNGLVGEYIDVNGVAHLAETEEKKQSQRRFPFIMPLRADDFDILINRAYMEGDGSYDDYIKIQNIRGNFAKLIKAYPKDQVSVVNIATGMVRPLVEARDEIERKVVADQAKNEAENSESYANEDFENYGKQITDEDELARLNWQNASDDDKIIFDN